MPEDPLFVDVPPPEVVWVLGSAADDESRQEPLGAIESGSSVQAGQVIIGLPGTSTAGVAPLSGRAGRAKRVRDSLGQWRWAVPVMLDDDAETEAVATTDPVRPLQLSKKDLPEWTNLILAAGLREKRHNSPDLVAQLSAAAERPIDTVICHAIEPDPLCPVQSGWAQLHGEALHRGLMLLSRLVGADRVIFAASHRDSRELTRTLRAAADLTPTPLDDPSNIEEPVSTEKVAQEIEARSGERGVQVVSLPHAYPQADPSLLVWTLLRRRVLPGDWPTQIGAICIDTATAVALGDLAAGSLLLRTQPLAIRDHSRDVGVLTRAWRGSTVEHVIHELNLHLAPGAAIRSGDYLRQQRIPPDAVLDGGEVVLHLESGQGILDDPDPCIRCGWCLEICPTGVHPATLLPAAGASDAKRKRLAVQGGASACIGCGLCDYVCPSRLPLRELTLKLRELE